MTSLDTKQKFDEFYYHFVCNNTFQSINNIPKECLSDRICYIFLEKTKGSLVLIPEFARTPNVCFHALRIKEQYHLLETLDSEIFLFNKSFLTKELITEICILVPSLLSYRTTFNESIPNWTFLDLCLGVVERNGLALQYLTAPYQTIEICKAAIRQTKRAIPYVNIINYDVSEIFGDFMERNNKIVFCDYLTNKIHLICSYESFEKVVDEFVKKHYTSDQIVYWEKKTDIDYEVYLVSTSAKLSRLLWGTNDLKEALVGRFMESTVTAL